MGINLKVLCGMGHRKYADMTPEETEKLIAAIERGEIKGLQAGPYYVMNKNTKRIVGKLDIKESQKLIMMPVVRGG